LFTQYQKASLVCGWKEVDPEKQVDSPVHSKEKALSDSADSVTSSHGFAQGKIQITSTIGWNFKRFGGDN
jgi:hypothetical protein